jgi:hypothetical protein
MRRTRHVDGRQPRKWNYLVRTAAKVPVIPGLTDTSDRRDLAMVARYKVLVCAWMTAIIILGILDG